MYVTCGRLMLSNWFKIRVLYRRAQNSAKGDGHQNSRMSIFLNRIYVHVDSYYTSLTELVDQTSFHPHRIEMMNSYEKSLKVLQNRELSTTM